MLLRKFYDHITCSYEYLLLQISCCILDKSYMVC
uniref:Uncharacterized protein n=1 Tax=Rhizophora mucronata TaxID=61149 RepID=A0A2P2MYR2_RHIMU